MDYDYFVIGAGSGGVRSARIAAQHGAKVGLAEARHLGGTCVNVGCVPKKLMTYAGGFSHALHDMPFYGWEQPKADFDWTKFIANKDNEIRRLQGIYQNLLQGAGVEIFRGYAALKDTHTVEINGQAISAQNILIAAGGKPRLPDFSGAEHVLVSDDMFALPRLPKKMVILGGGYIAVEFACIFHNLGVDVTMVNRGNMILRGFDDDLRLQLCEDMRARGIEMHFDTTVDRLEQCGSAYCVHTSAGHSIDCDVVFAAIGRVAETDRLGLSALGIETTPTGQIDVNDDWQTSVDNIYAIGDVTTSRFNLTPYAIAQGHILADRLFCPDKPPRDCCFDTVATAIFSDPPLSTVGLTEEEAHKEGIDYAVYRSSFRTLKDTLTDGKEKTTIKLLTDKTSDRVIGAHMLGPDSPEIMQGIAIAMSCKATKKDFDRTLGIHPTAAEEWVTLKEVMRS